MSPAAAVLSLEQELRAAVGDPADVRLRAVDRHAAASDASHFLLTPQAVVVASTGANVGQLLQGFLGMLRNSGLEVQVMDAVQFVTDRVLPLLPVNERLDSLTLHPTCSSLQLGANDALTRVVNAVAGQVHVPVGWLLRLRRRPRHAPSRADRVGDGSRGSRGPRPRRLRARVMQPNL